MKFFIYFILPLLIFFGFTALAHPQDIDVERLADAIWLAEGGLKAEYAYGIRSIKYNDIDHARQICINTIKNNIKRFQKQTEYKDYLEFLASRYCPVGVENDPKGLNKNWLKNVRYYYERGA